MGRLRGGRIEGPESDIVCSSLPGFHREMAAVVTGLADLCRRAEQRPRFPHVSVTLPEMYAVRTDALCKGHAVIDDKGNLGVGTDALQRIGEADQLMLVNMLHAKLERGRKARLKSGLQAVRKRAANLLRADEVKLAGSMPARSKVAGKFARDVIQGQAGTSLTDAS